jgi:hypothetical protein
VQAILVIGGNVMLHPFYIHCVPFSYHLKQFNNNSAIKISTFMQHVNIELEARNGVSNIITRRIIARSHDQCIQTTLYFSFDFRISLNCEADDIQ